VCHGIAPTKLGMSLFYAMRIVSLVFTQKTNLSY
jgi:hypothetical protein